MISIDPTEHSPFRHRRCGRTNCAQTNIKVKQYINGTVPLATLAQKGSIYTQLGGKYF